MEIVVCLKEIIDPEIPPSQFKIDPVAKRQLQEGHALVISTYDENALEVALKLKEAAGGAVTALCLGAPTATTALKKALAMGADQAILVSDPALLAADAFAVASALAAAIRKRGPFDLVLAGCESGDWASRAVGPLLAEELALPCVVYASRVEAADGRVQVRKVVEDGYEVIEAPLPLLVTITSDESNIPRFPKLKDIMAAGRKPIPTWTAAHLGLAAGEKAAGRVAVAELSIPIRETRCEILDGESPAEKVDLLVSRLRDLKLL
ncbi:MAG: electron transfer flavoprotein subunit beta/FixA family protein, partial [candidate division NC10 bacterium]|nr:electron transfer flavoprotein subunit beta/FixA family protein [candidate division NC10 bacterium]